VHARGLGHRVIAADDDPRAEGLGRADVAEVADLDDADVIEALARSHGVEAVLTLARDRTVLTVARDRAVLTVAIVSERLGLPCLARDAAHRFTHKLAMRRTLAEEGLPQPAFAAARSLAEGRAALETVGLPAVLKPADGERQHGVFRIDDPGDLESHLHAALAESRSQEALLERFVDGAEMNAVVVARDGVVRLLTLSDRLRPEGPGFGVAWAHVHPARIHSDQLVAAERTAERVAAVLGLRHGVGLVQLIATSDGEVSVIGAAARTPSAPLTELVRHAVGVDLVDLSLRVALGQDVPDEVASPRFSLPVAIRSLTAAPGPLPTGIVTRVGALGPVLSVDGVVAEKTYLSAGTVVAPVRTADDRHGHVVATGPTTVEALESADHAAGLLVVEVE